MMRLLLALLLACSASGVAAQPAKKSQMSDKERQRMRDDMREAYRDRQQRPGQHKMRQMSPEERGQLRRDIEDANRDLRR